jgi:hypothetical protein
MYVEVQERYVEGKLAFQKAAPGDCIGQKTFRSLAPLREVSTMSSIPRTCQKQNVPRKNCSMCTAALLPPKNIF